jgi:hypothetical protein
MIKILMDTYIFPLAFSVLCKLVIQTKYSSHFICEYMSRHNVLNPLLILMSAWLLRVW